MDTNYWLNSLLVTYDITLSAVVLLTHGIICRIMVGCEVWSITAYTLKRLSVAWNNVFRKIFNVKNKINR